MKTIFNTLQFVFYSAIVFALVFLGTFYFVVLSKMEGKLS